MKKKNNGKHKQFLHVIMIKSIFFFLNIFFQPLSNVQIITYRLFHKLANTFPLHTPFEWKIGYKVIIDILNVNTAFYIYGNIRFKLLSRMVTKVYLLGIALMGSFST